MRHVILGAGGHARSLKPHLPADAVMVENDKDVRSDDVVYVGVGDVKLRRKLYGKFSRQIDPAPQMMPLAYAHPSVTLGVNVLVNTGAQIDHDCVIGDHCVIAPGAILCGTVTLGEGCFIGAGAIIIQGVTLAPETFIQAGALVVGQDDIRAPIRVLRPDGTLSSSARAPGARQQWDHKQRAWR